MKRILLLCLCLGLHFAIAQNPSEIYQEEAIEQRTFDEATWQEIVSEIDYSKDLQPDEPKEEEEVDEARNWENPFEFNSEFGRMLSIALLSILGVILLVIVLRFLLKPPTKNVQITDKEAIEVSVEELAENLEAHDPSGLIEQAIGTGNYRLAVRLYYLKTIRELSLKDEIKWQRDKTNHSYLHEMQAHQLYQSFQEMTRIFERVWYGNRDLSVTDFEQIRPKAERLLAQIDAIASEKENI